MGISHPLSDDYDALRAAVLSPERTPPSSPTPPPQPGHHCLEHEVSRMDTLAGIAIKYGVEISDIKRANGLVSDSQMFAHKTLLIPLPGMPMPASVMRLNSSGQRMKRTWAPNHQHDDRDITDSANSAQKAASAAMSTLQRYYGLSSQKGNTTDCSTEMSVYHKGSSQSSLSETLLSSSAAPPGTKGADRIWDHEDPFNGFSSANGGNENKSNGVPKPKQDVSMRRRQKVEAESNTTDTQQDDFLADPIKAIKSLLPRPISSSIRLNVDTGSTDSNQQKSNVSFLNGLKSVRKSLSTPNFADGENGVVSVWSSSKWTFNHESFTRPLLDGLPKPVVSARRMKTAMD